MTRKACDRRSGFTLVEALIAVAIAVIVVGLAWVLVGTVSRAVISHRERTDRRGMAGQALQRVQADLVSLFLSAEDPECFFTVQAEPFFASFCTMKREEGLPPVARAVPRQIQYRLEGMAPSGMALVRVESTLSGPVWHLTNRLALHVEEWRLDVHDGLQWRATWPPSDGARERPRAARASIRLAGMDAALHAEWWMPVGYVATSRMIRAANP